jgi:hypothetical protein
MLVKASTLFDVVVPLLDRLDPQRLSAVRSELGKLEMVHGEGLALVMPELVVRH